MNSNRKYALRKLFYLVALGFSLVPCSALAQTKAPSLAGKFALTSEARCGSAVLLPGNYSFALTSDGPIAVIRISNGKHVVAAFVSPTQVRKISPDQDVLKLVRMAGGPYVQSLDLPALGVEYMFPVPKSAEILTGAPNQP